MVFMRRRPLLRAAVVGGGAYAMGKRSAQRAAEQDQRAAQQDQAQQDQAQQAPASARSAAVPTPSMLDQLNQLNRLHKQGALTDEEFRAAKAKLLG